MDVVEAAVSWVRFFVRQDFESLRGVLSENFTFEGPLLKANSADEYIKALEADVSVPGEAVVENAMQQGDQVTLFYRYRKPGVEVSMAQWFEIEDGLVKASRVWFDASPFR